MTRPILPGEIDLHIERAKAMAHNILSPKQEILRDSVAPQPYYSTPSFYHHPYGGGYGTILARWLFPPTVHHTHQHNIYASESKKEKSEVNALLAIALGAATLFLTYSFGKEIGTYSNVCFDLEKLKEQKDVAAYKLNEKKISNDQLFQHPKAYELMKRVSSVYQYQEEILNIYKSYSYKFFFIKGVTLAGLAMLSASAFYPALTTLWTQGSILAAGGAFSWAFMTGMNSTERQVESKALDLLSEIQLIDNLTLF